MATAAFSLTIGGVLTIITELVVGSLSDRFERKNMIGIMVACTGVLSGGYAIYLLNTLVPDLIPCYFLHCPYQRIHRCYHGYHVVALASTTMMSAVQRALA